MPRLHLLDFIFLPVSQSFNFTSTYFLNAYTMCLHVTQFAFGPTQQFLTFSFFLFLFFSLLYLLHLLPGSIILLKEV